MARIRNFLGHLLDLLRDINLSLTNLGRTYSELILNKKHAPVVFCKKIVTSAIESIEHFYKNDSIELLEFNFMLIKLVFSENITVKDILNDTGKNLENSIFYKKEE